MCGRGAEVVMVTGNCLAEPYSLQLIGDGAVAYVFVCIHAHDDVGSLVDPGLKVYNEIVVK